MDVGKKMANTKASDLDSGHLEKLVIRDQFRSFSFEARIMRTIFEL
jgi:hypothetical protein